MVNLNTEFATLQLRNPIIVSSCVLTYKPENGNFSFYEQKT